MATVQISDIYDPLVWAQAVQEAAIELNAFVSSGVARNTPEINQLSMGPGAIGELPFYHPIGTDEPNYSSDDNTSYSVPANITSGKQVFRKAFMNNSWSTMDLAVEIASADPVEAITNRIGGYWGTISQRRLIRSLDGVLADNIANDSGDMAFTAGVAGTADPGAVDADDLISATAVINTWATMGDHLDQLVAIGLHSVVYNNLAAQNLIDFIPNSRGEVNIPTYMGKRVILDDGMTAVADGGRVLYTTVLFGEGSVAIGQGDPKNPSAYDRSESSGDGGGEDIIYSRETEVIHPYGFAFDSSAIAGQSATEAELADAAQWDRVYSERKNVSLAFLRTNG